MSRLAKINVSEFDNSKHRQLIQSKGVCAWNEIILGLDNSLNYENIRKLLNNRLRILNSYTYLNEPVQEFALEKLEAST